MKAAALGGQEANVVAEYILKILGLHVCANTMVGDEMFRGISGGQRKRVTTGEIIGLVEYCSWMRSPTGLTAPQLFRS
uniref:ABC transporter domain-containing protein n=1 Tax=Arundo donax TaxID=35708 RepID=A0A0A9BMR8_ARUDO